MFKRIKKENCLGANSSRWSSYVAVIYTLIPAKSGLLNIALWNLVVFPASALCTVALLLVN